MPDVNMVFTAQTAAIGSMVFGYFNDSYFWVINRMLGVKNARCNGLVVTSSAAPF
jgi:GntP family gluconate:H+ symporter